MIIDEEVKIAIQVNGKVRGEMMINTKDAKEEVIDKAMKNKSILRYLDGQKSRKIIYIKNRLINIVL